MAEEIDIEVGDIYLDAKNPRFESEQKNQRAALEKIVNGETLALARHIAKHGLNPLERMAVFFDEKTKKYVTAEGNRRLAALKLLNNFSLLDSLKVSTPIRAELKKTSKNVLASLKIVPCIQFGSKGEPAIWVKLKHTGKNSGVGTVQWDREQQQRFDAEYSDHKPPQLQLLDFLRSEFVGDKNISARLADNFPMTPLERLAGDPEVREFLGIELEDKHLYASLEKSEILKAFKKIIYDITDPDKTKRVTTRTLNVKSDRRKYLGTFKKSEIPSHKMSVALWPLDALAGHEKSGRQQQKPTPPTEKRKKLITPTCVLSIKNNQRINDIYHNLKNDLDVEKYANAVSVLARLFIEMSVNHYLVSILAKSEAEIQSRSYSLDSKLNDVINDLKAKGKITASAKQSIGKEMGNSNSAFHPNSLNAFVHNPDFHPSAMDLKRGWNNIEPLIIGIWS
jgi:hypothetical protein